MNNKTPFVLAGLVIVALMGWLVFSEKQTSLAPEPVVSTPTATSTTATSTTSTSPAPVSSGITMAQVAQHNSRTSCWAAINGFVYDLTSWIPKHPGGEQAILGLCGTDGTATFTGKHGGNSKVLTVLAGFKISGLAQ